MRKHYLHRNPMCKTCGVAMKKIGKVRANGCRFKYPTCGAEQ